MLRSLSPALPILGRVIVCAVAALGSAAAPAADRAGRDLLKVHQQKHEELRQKLQTALAKIAKQCDENGFATDAARIRTLAAPLDPQKLQLEPLPTEVQPEIPNNLPEAERAWRTQLRKVQQEHSHQLFLLATRLVNQEYSSYAFQVVREAAFHDPDSKPARNVLGFVRYENEWVTPFRRDMLKGQNVWHEKYGWLKKDQVSRYDNGERYFKTPKTTGRWMSARQEAELRRDFDNAWEVRTDHFLVRTNHSLERGVEVAQSLEDFHDFFVESFAAFFQSPQQLRALFKDVANGSPPRTLPHKVHYFATRDEYVARLEPKIPQIAITNALYYTDDRTAYFYHDPAADNSPTWFHEATHQLLYEVSPKGRAIADREHFWVVEGIACYMESFRRDGGRISVGDPQYTRFGAARYRYVHDKYYVPLAKFASMGLKEFQTDPDIAKNYSQASGLVHFFMHYDEGRYRDALIEHLTELYSVSRRMAPAAQGLDALTDVDYGELDRQYGEYTRELQTALRPREPAQPGQR